MGTTKVKAVDDFARGEFVAVDSKRKTATKGYVLGVPIAIATCFIRKGEWLKYDNCGNTEKLRRYGTILPTRNLWEAF